MLLKLIQNALSPKVVTTGFKSILDLETDVMKTNEKAKLWHQICIICLPNFT